MRLIDADALKAHFAWWKDTDPMKTVFIDIINAQPTIVPEEKKEENDG